jgi:hypothetical protein
MEQFISSGEKGQKISQDIAGSLNKIRVRRLRNRDDRSIFIFQRVQTNSVAHPSSYHGLLSPAKAVGALSLPRTTMYYQSYVFIPALPHASSRYGA